MISLAPWLRGPSPSGEPRGLADSERPIHHDKAVKEQNVTGARTMRGRVRRSASRTKFSPESLDPDGWRLISFGCGIVPAAGRILA